MREYILYNEIIQKEPFVTATKELLSTLGINLPVIDNAPADKGCDKLAFDIDNFHYNNAKVLALANKTNRDILTIEDSSFLSLNLTKKKLSSSIEMKNEINSKLQKEGLEVNLEIDIVPLVLFLEDKISTENIKNSFGNFNASLYLGSYSCDLEQFFDISIYQQVIKKSGVNLVNYNLANNSCGYEISYINKEVSYRLAGDLLLDMFDNAADFVLVNDVRSFIIFDKEQKRIEKVVGREIGLPVLNISQLFLASLGVTDEKKLGLQHHSVKLNFI